VGSLPGKYLNFWGLGRPGKKRVFSDFVVYPLHKNFPRAESGKSLVFTPTSKGILFLLCGE